MPSALRCSTLHTGGMKDVCTSKKIPEELINEVITTVPNIHYSYKGIYSSSWLPEFGIGIGDMDIELHMAHHTSQAHAATIQPQPSQNGCSMREGKQHTLIQLLTQLHLHATSGTKGINST